MTEPEPVHLGVHLVQDDDLEAFAYKVQEAVMATSADGLPDIAISHAPTVDGFNYLAVVTGQQLGPHEPSGD